MIIPGNNNSAKFGYENPSIYKNISRHSYNMNYANMTKSFNDMWSLMLGRHGKGKTEQNLMAKIVKTDWFAHVENILSSAKRVSELISNGDSALIYCPSGNHGTPLLSSLA